MRSFLQQVQDRNVPPDTSWMTRWVAGVSGVYRIFPSSNGFRACQIIRDMGFKSMFFTRLLQ